jgi:hypothetical protein
LDQERGCCHSGEGISGKVSSWLEERNVKERTVKELYASIWGSALFCSRHSACFSMVSGVRKRLLQAGEVSGRQSSEHPVESFLSSGLAVALNSSCQSIGNIDLTLIQRCDGGTANPAKVWENVRMGVLLPLYPR